ncbi:hypothetical protein F4824DRAFT_515344 [Ustulina deusta]|nr:hypothetical protein F4824DRAFT_515344 [Ustulina deusta]
MDSFENGCHGNAAAIRLAAQRHLDDIISSPWYAGSKDTEDVARVRHQIDVLRARNELSSAELLEVAHSCGVCNAATLPGSTHADCAMCTPGGATDSTHKTCAVALSLGLMADLKEKQAKIEAIAAQILNRNALVKKLEGHLKTYGNIQKSLSIVTPPGNSMEYHYQIDTQHGVSLVIHDRDSSSSTTSNSTSNHQARSKPLNLVDSVVLPPISTPVLAPVSAAPAPAILPATQEEPQKTSEPKEEAEEEENPTPVPVPQPQPQAPFLQIWDSRQERYNALRRHVGSGPIDPEQVPLIFHHGIQHRPAVPGGARHSSRMVVFSDLRPGTTWKDVLARVRGGAVLRAVRADATTMFVYFVRERHAHAYAQHVAAAGHSVTVRGAPACVRLAPTPSYPVPAALMRDVLHRGATRRLAVPRPDAESGTSLWACLARGKIWDFTIVQQQQSVVDAATTTATGTATATATLANTPTVATTAFARKEEEGGKMKKKTNGSSNGSDELSEEWVVVADDDDDDSKVVANVGKKKPENKTTAMTTTTDIIIYLSFRDVVHAQAAHQLIREAFPSCGVHYARDCCAGPLEELD